MSGGTLLTNSASLVVGRIALSALRMIAALIVARLAGANDFGAYMLVLAYVALFEWLVDFGQTDIAVRDIARAIEQRGSVLAALARIKRIQGIAGATALPLLLTLMEHDRAMTLAGIAGSCAILANAALQPARADLRLAMRMDLDIAAELLGAMLMLPLLAIAAWHGASLPLLTATFAAARIVQAALTIHWAKPLARSGHASPGATWLLWREAAPLGFAGLLVVTYDALAPLFLSRLLDLKAVALYAAAARFIFPVLVAVQAIAAAFFPVLSQASRRDRAALAAAQQAALVLSTGVAALLFAGIHGGATFLMGLLGGEFLAGVEVLRLMAWTLLLRAITTAMSPLIVVAGWQGKAMLLTLVSLSGQCLALLLLVPRFGVLGAAIGYLLVELMLGTVIVSWLGQRAIAIRLDWKPVAGLLLIATASAVAVDISPIRGTFWGGAAGALLVVALTAISAGFAGFSFRPLWQELRKGRAIAVGGGA
jgi:O-antigen/teichoic acid export membrane protein